MEDHYALISRSYAGGRDWEYNVLRYISDSEYYAICEAVRQVREFTREDLLPYVQFSLEKVLDIENRLIESLQNRDVDEPEIEAAHIELSWSIFTALSAIALHQEQTRTKISRHYGKDSAQSQYVGKVFAEAFDNSYSYRLCCKLRQYIVHRSMGSLAIQMERYRSGANSEIKAFLNVYFDRDALLDERDVWKSLVLNELETGPEQVHPIPHLKDAVSVVRGISARTRDLIFPDIRKQIDELEGVERVFAGRSGTPLVARLPRVGDLKKNTQFKISACAIDFNLAEEARRALGSVSERTMTSD